MVGVPSSATTGESGESVVKEEMEAIRLQCVHEVVTVCQVVMGNGKLSNNYDCRL